MYYSNNRIIEGFLSVYSLLALHRLLSDAEIAEDVIQNVLGVDGPCDGSEVMQRLSDVARD